MKTKRFIKLLFLIFLAGLFVAILGCKETKPYCPVNNTEIYVPLEQIDSAFQEVKDQPIIFDVEVHYFSSSKTPDWDKVGKAFIRANNSMKGYIRLNRTKDYLIKEDYDLDDWRNNYKLRDSIVLSHYSDTTLNIFVAETSSNLLGFTPVITDYNAELSQLFLNWDAFGKYESTLIHEFSHYLGLTHPQDCYKDAYTLTEDEKNCLADLHGITENHRFNHLNYSCYTDYLTDYQLGKMMHFAINVDSRNQLFR